MRGPAAIYSDLDTSTRQRAKGMFRRIVTNSHCNLERGSRYVRNKAGCAKEKSLRRKRQVRHGRSLYR